MTATNDILISIRPKHVDDIMDGSKTVELRRKFAKHNVVGSWMLIYESSPTKAIVGAAQIVGVEQMKIRELWRQFKNNVCVSHSDFLHYFSGTSEGVGVLLGPPSKFDISISMSELRAKYGFRPPQSYQYLNGALSAILDDKRVQIPNRYKHSNRA